MLTFVQTKLKTKTIVYGFSIIRRTADDTAGYKGILQLRMFAGVIERDEHQNFPKNKLRNWPTLALWA